MSLSLISCRQGSLSAAMTRDFFDPTPEHIDVILIDEATISPTQRLIVGCEHCDKSAEIPFHWLLDVTGRRGSETDYLLSRPATCLQCGGEITEKTLVEWNDDGT